MRLCESMKRHVACSKAHVDVAHRSGDVRVLSRTKIHCIPSMKSEKNGRSTTSRSTSLLQRNHLAPADNEGQRHIEKQTSPDLKNTEKTKPLI
jgi:hypothetical protein